MDWVYSHSINVAIISAMLAKALGLKKELKDIALDALLHDIGKLMIPKMILFNARELTTEEMFYMRQHCDLGVSMLKGHPIGQASMDIIGQHHERLDGSGYPTGLKDAQIPLHSRIVMIAISLTPSLPTGRTNLQGVLNPRLKNSGKPAISTRRLL